MLFRSAHEHAGRFPQALAGADEAMRLFQEAYCLAHPAKPGEFRAVWCHSAYGVKNRTWDDAVGNLKANGFTAVFPNMLWGGVAYYPSQVLPVASDIATKGDQVAECLAACRKHGLQIHVWKVDWNLGRDAPKAFVDRLRAEHRLQMSDTGELTHCGPCSTSCHVERMDIESLPTGIDTPICLHSSAMPSTVAYRRASSPGTPHGAIQLAESLTLSSVPTSAAASAGASFTPSPAMATSTRSARKSLRWSGLRALTARTAAPPASRSARRSRSCSTRRRQIGRAHV